jgi:hypothetical protein
MPMPIADHVRRWLLWSWFAALPASALVVAAFVRERACADPYALLPAVAARPAAAYAVAAAYVGGHVWLAAAWLVTLDRSGRLVPGPGDVRRVWGTRWYAPASVLAVVALEQIPPGLWRAAGRWLGLC